jgi:hypothetical protein
MTKHLVLNQITLCADGSIGLQWLKQVIDPDTGMVLFSEPHRSVVDFDGDVDQQVQAVSNHLQQMGYPVAPEKHKALIKKIDGIARKDTDISAVRAAKITARAARSASAPAS